jgi:hypothetical protein
MEKYISSTSFSRPISSAKRERGKALGQRLEIKKIEI